MQCTKGSLSIYKLENHNSCTLLFCIHVCMITYNKYHMNKFHSCFISHYCVLCTCTNLMYCPVLLCTTKMIHCKNIFRIMPVNNHAADIYYHMSVIHHVQMLLTKDPTLPIWLRHTVLFVREKYYLIPRNFIVLAVVNMYTETVVAFEAKILQQRYKTHHGSVGCVRKIFCHSTILTMRVHWKCITWIKSLQSIWYQWGGKWHHRIPRRSGPDKCYYNQFSHILIKNCNYFVEDTFTNI